MLLVFSNKRQVDKRLPKQILKFHEALYLKGRGILVTDHV